MLENGSCSSRTWLENKVFCETSEMEILPHEEGTCLQKLGSKVSVHLLKLQMLVTSSQSNQCCSLLTCTMKWHRKSSELSVPACSHQKQSHYRALAPFLPVLLWVGPLHTSAMQDVVSIKRNSILFSVKAGREDGVKHVSGKQTQEWDFAGNIDIDVPAWYESYLLMQIEALVSGVGMC